MPEFGDVIDTVARDENIDIVLAYEIFEHSLGYPVEELRQLTDEVVKPIIFTVAGPDEALTRDRQRMEDAGVVTYDSPERGAFATSVLTDSVR
jgi:acetyltransferase